jgi:hypothetical protein
MALNSFNLVGSAADVVNLLAASIKKIAEKEAAYRECSERLSWYGYQMSECRSNMKKWTTTWCPDGKPFKDAEYQYFWGAEGYREILARVDQIRRDDGDIQEKLQGNGVEPLTGAKQPSPDDWKAWTQQCRWNPNGSKLTAARKVGFAISGSKVIKENISSIREKVHSLSQYSRMLFFEMQDKEDSGLEINHRVATLPRLNKRVKTFSKFMDEILSHSTDPTCIRHLILDVPEDEDMISCFHCLSCLQQDLDIQTRFVSETTPPAASMKIEAFTFAYEDDEHWDTAVISEAGAEVVSAELLRGPMLFSDISTPAEWKKGEVDRARTSIGLVNWALMLVHTKWVKDLSIRRIHYVTYYGSQALDQVRFTCSVLEPASANEQNTFRKTHIFDRPLLLLAVTLAELIMGLDIEVHLENDEVKEYAIVCQDSSKCCSEDKLLREVARKSRSPQYRDAVKRCLELDRKVMRRGQRVEDIEVWKATILEP